MRLPDLPPLPEPARERTYFCNKCGHFGPVGESHPNCNYLAVGSGPYFTADQLRAAMLAYGEIVREACAEAVEDDVMPGRSAEYRNGYVEAIRTAAAAIRSTDP